MPPRSTGCYACRKRKIRCDEARPGCQRCSTHGIPCPGYRREDGVIQFEDQTDLTVQRVKGQCPAKAAADTRKAMGTSSPKANAATVLVRKRQGTSDLWLKAPSVQLVYSPELGRQQLHETFLSIYSPRMTGSKGVPLNFLHEIAHLAPFQPALMDSLDTLALAQIGSVHKDERVCSAAIGSYGKALRSLATAMTTAFAKGMNSYDDSILAAANLLVVCEFFDPIKTEGSGWFGHVAGVEQLSFAQGPRAPRSDIGLMLLLNARHSSSARSYLLRKADPYATPAWRLALHKLYQVDPRHRLFDLVIQVPGLLERYDGLNYAAALGLDEADALLADCERLEMDLRNYYLDLQAMEGSSLYTLAPIEKFKVFASVVSDRTLPTAFVFKDFILSWLHSQYWVAMHYLRTTMKALDEYRQDLDPGWQPGRTGVTSEELNEYVFDLCRCIPAMLEPEAGTQGHIGTFIPLAVILMSFRNRQNWRWLKWGLCVKENIYTKGLSQPQIKEESLPVARVHPRGESPFDHGASPITLDDLKDVDLSIDWGAKLPGMATAVSGSLVEEEDTLADDLELRLELDTRLVNQSYLPTEPYAMKFSPPTDA